MNKWIHLLISTYIKKVQINKLSVTKFWLSELVTLLQLFLTVYFCPTKPASWYGAKSLKNSLRHGWIVRVLEHWVSVEFKVTALRMIHVVTERLIGQAMYLSGRQMYMSTFHCCICQAAHRLIDVGCGNGMTLMYVTPASQLKLMQNINQHRVDLFWNVQIEQDFHLWLYLLIKCCASAYDINGECHSDIFILKTPFKLNKTLFVLMTYSPS